MTLVNSFNEVSTRPIINCSNDSDTPYNLAVSQTRSLLHNLSAASTITVNLPAAVAGLEYEFYVKNGNTMFITANGTDIITLAGNMTSPGSYISSLTVGSSVGIVCIGGGEWVATSINGTWTTQ